MTTGQINSKYPVLLIHGTGFRDRKLLGYWGRIPAALEERGVKIFYGNQDSWATVEQNAALIKNTLEQIIKDENCEKVNIIAHSKGGLEARYLVSALGCAHMVASLTTVSTPHHGSKTMDMLWRLPKFIFKIVSFFANLWFRLLGDKHPDFFNACGQFTTAYTDSFNKENPDAEGIYYQSFATVMGGPFSDILMLFPYLAVKAVEGQSDGLVTPDSARWTNFGGVWHSCGRRGISHADSVDVRRRRLTKKECPDKVSDIRKPYIDIVAGLAEMGF